jgi:hypothetical protein
MPSKPAPSSPMRRPPDPSELGTTVVIFTGVLGSILFPRECPLGLAERTRS